MYNRYIPQPDGSYRRNRMQEPVPVRRPQPPPPPLKVPETVQEEHPIVEQLPEPPPAQEVKKQENHPAPHPVGNSPGTFLKNLLPKDFDTGDLLIVFLLLLMADDCGEEDNAALLTLMLYLFL